MKLRSYYTIWCCTVIYRPHSYAFMLHAFVSEPTTAKKSEGRSEAPSEGTAEGCSWGRGGLQLEATFGVLFEWFSWVACDRLRVRMQQLDVHWRVGSKQPCQVTNKSSTASTAHFEARQQHWKESCILLVGWSEVDWTRFRRFFR